MSLLVVIILCFVPILTNARYFGYNENTQSLFNSNPPLPITSPIERRPSGFLDYTSNRQSTKTKFVKPVIKHGPPIISKSFFIHEAPVELERKVQVIEKHHTIHPKKHYNIIFIKTPRVENRKLNYNNVNVFPQNEEKTIVYVLVGRGQNQEQVHSSDGELSVPKSKPPSKPEVVFVKYSNEADAQRAISHIQENFNNQQGTVSILGIDNRQKNNI